MAGEFLVRPHCQVTFERFVDLRGFLVVRGERQRLSCNQDGMTREARQNAHASNDCNDVTPRLCDCSSIPSIRALEIARNSMFPIMSNLQSLQLQLELLHARLHRTTAHSTWHSSASQPGALTHIFSTHISLHPRLQAHEDGVSLTIRRSG